MQHALTLRTRACAVRGFQTGLRTWWWLVKMMLPITFGVALLQWAGVIATLSAWLTPAFSHIGLNGEGVLTFLTGISASIYAAIGVMGTLNLDYRSVTIIAVMTLIAHNLIVESVVQRKSGSRSAWGMATLRLAMALLTACLSLNILQQILREFHLIGRLTAPLTPLMRLFGLPGDCAFLWIVLNTLGLTYGSSVMIGEVESGAIPRRDARLLNAHAAMNHSLLEDTLLYFALGIGLFWLMVPRIVMAMAVVWTMRLKEALQRRRHPSSTTAA